MKVIPPQTDTQVEHIMCSDEWGLYNPWWTLGTMIHRIMGLQSIYRGVHIQKVIIISLREEGASDQKTSRGLWSFSVFRVMVIQVWISLCFFSSEEAFEVFDLKKPSGEKVKCLLQKLTSPVAQGDQHIDNSNFNQTFFYQIFYMRFKSEPIVHWDQRYL